MRFIIFAGFLVGAWAVLPAPTSGLLDVPGIGLVLGEQVKLRSELLINGKPITSYNVFYEGYEEYNTVLVVYDGKVSSDKRIKDVAARAGKFPIDQTKTTAQIAKIAAATLNIQNMRYAERNVYWYDMTKNGELRLVYELYIWPKDDEMRGRIIMADSIMGEIYQNQPSIISASVVSTGIDPDASQAATTAAYRGDQLTDLPGFPLAQGEQVKERARFQTQNGNIIISYDVFFDGIQEFNSVLVVQGNQVISDRRIPNIQSKAALVPLSKMQSREKIAQIAGKLVNINGFISMSAETSDYWYDQSNGRLTIVYELSIWPTGSSNLSRGNMVIADSITGQVFENTPILITADMRAQEQAVAPAGVTGSTEFLRPYELQLTAQEGARVKAEYPLNGGRIVRSYAVYYQGIQQYRAVVTTVGYPGFQQQLVTDTRIRNLGARNGGIQKSDAVAPDQLLGTVASQLRIVSPPFDWRSLDLYWYERGMNGPVRLVYELSLKSRAPNAPATGVIVIVDALNGSVYEQTPFV